MKKLTFIFCIVAIFSWLIFLVLPFSSLVSEAIFPITTNYLKANAEENKTAIEKITENNPVSVTETEIKDVLYSNFIADLDNVNTVYYDELNTFFYIAYKDGSFGVTYNPNYENFQKDLLEAGVIVKDFNSIQLVKGSGRKVKSEQEVYGTINFCITMLISIIITYFILRKIYGNDTLRQYFELGKKKQLVTDGTNGKTVIDKEIDANVKKFSDVAGLKEVKKDMESLVDFLKYKEKYTKAGAKLPKGVILYGPPGTGKTLLAKAVAGEAGIPFLYMSGSDFIEMYVGVGAKRVRELFAKAKKQAPCIVFIDEIDTIGGKRTHSDNSEDRKTINELLTQMDGFKETENILVIAATNRLEDLDSALVRPGRFTNKFCVPLPQTAKERLEVIELYTKNKKFSEDVDFKNLAKETIGFSPAKIEALLNEAAIISVQKRKEYINKEILDEAMFKILLSGHIKENQNDRDRNELEIVAWHEAGHALIGKLNGKEIPKVTILSSTSGAGGVTFSTPSKTGLFLLKI